MLKKSNLKMYSFIFLLFLTVISVINCSREKKTLAELGDEKVTLGEFEKQYLKTVNNLDSAKNKSIEEKRQFLNLYINFRLKVKDARDRGLLNNPDLQKEISEYKRTYSPTYLVDKEIVEAEIKKLYERKKEEVRASHILINLAENPAPQDSIAAYQKADTIIQKLKDGADFGDVAVEYSMDRTVKTNRGDLYYFTAGMTVPEFEDAVYDMKVGEYTKKPVRTMFGLHIVKLTDRKSRVESIRASHILIQDKRDSLGNIIDSAATYQRALEVYNKAKSGEDFSSLVSQYTEDVATKQTGGDLGYFDRRRMTQPFDSAVFSMRVNEISGPIRTQFGWHIIKKTDEKPYLPYEKQKDNLKNEYKRTKKYKDDYNKYVIELKKKYDFAILDDGFNFLRSKFDTIKTIADYNLDSLFNQQDKEKVIAKYDGGEVKLNDIINHLNVNRDFQRMALTASTLNMIINSAGEQPVLNKRANELDIESDDEYKANLTDYENGLLVFRIDQDELWSKVKLNDDELKSYYESNKTKYTKVDSAKQTVYKPFEEVKAEISNEMQQVRYKETEKAYLESLRQKYPVKIYEEVLAESFKE
jgi:peptidyl-prolyl cis-trans isomerase SurA